MEYVIGFLIGALVCMVFFGMGVCVGNNKPSDNKSNKPSDEDKVTVIENVKRSTYGWEREVMDAIEDEIKTRASRDVIT